MDEIIKKLLVDIADLHKIPEGSYNIRQDGKCLSRNSTTDIEIVSKKDRDGINIYVKPNVKNKSCHIPVIISKSGIDDVVYNNFYIGDNADVVIVAGCGINCTSEKGSSHNGIHSFILGKNSKVKYVEKHLAIGNIAAKKVLSPTTKIKMKENSIFEMQTIQIGGVDYAERKTFAKLEKNAKLIINEKILTTDNQSAKTKFKINLNGENCSSEVVSRSVAKNNSMQEFNSVLIGNNSCYGRVECDAIMVDNSIISSTPKIIAKTSNASLTHEAVIGKIAGEQLIKLMSLGLTKEQAENEIIKGFLN